MRIAFLSLTSLLTVCSCSNRTETPVADILPHYEITDKKDTINYVDKNGLKQGHWIIYEVGLSGVNAGVTFSHDSLKEQQENNIANPSGKQAVEEGFYKDDKKTGCWKRFGTNGQVKDSVNYN